MKISLYLPKGTADPTQFVRDELAQARNIKSKATRKSVEAGLRKLLGALAQGHEGIALFTDGSEIIVERYEGRQKKYFCGREYLLIKEEPYAPYLLCVIDSKEAAIGVTDGEHIRILWEGESFVMGKHGRGG